MGTNIYSNNQIFILISLIFIMLGLIFVYYVFNVNNSNIGENLTDIGHIYNSDESNKNIIPADLYSYESVISSGNIENCDNIIEENLIETCKLNLVECSNDDCHFSKARFEMNVSICFSIEDVAKRTSCSAAIKRSSILRGAVNEDDVSICEEFDDLTNIEHCQDNYYIAKSFNEDNLDFCNNIKNEVIKNECELQ